MVVMEFKKDDTVPSLERIKRRIPCQSTSGYIGRAQMDSLLAECVRREWLQMEWV